MFFWCTQAKEDPVRKVEFLMVSEHCPTLEAPLDDVEFLSDLLELAKQDDRCSAVVFAELNGLTKCIHDIVRKTVDAVERFENATGFSFTKDDEGNRIITVEYRDEEAA